MCPWQPRHRQWSDLVRQVIAQQPRPGPGEALYLVLDLTTIRGGFVIAASPEDAAMKRGKPLANCQITEYEKGPPADANEN